MIKIYTDGSCIGKNQRGAKNEGGWGYVVYENNRIIAAKSGRKAQTTNNEMELTAIVEALIDYGVPSDSWDIPVLYSDSAYSVNSLTCWYHNWRNNAWKRKGDLPIENLSLIQTAISLIEGAHYLDIQKIKGHEGLEGNEIADLLATGKIAPNKLLELNYEELQQILKNKK